MRRESLGAGILGELGRYFLGTMYTVPGWTVPTGRVLEVHSDDGGADSAEFLKVGNLGRQEQAEQDPWVWCGYLSRRWGLLESKGSNCLECLGCIRARIGPRPPHLLLVTHLYLLFLFYFIFIILRT